MPQTFYLECDDFATFGNIKITRYAERAMAEAALKQPGGRVALIAEGPDDLRTGRSTETLVRLYNALANEGEETIKEFHTKTVACQRTFDRIERRAPVEITSLPAETDQVDAPSDGSAVVADAETKEATMAKSKKTKKNGIKKTRKTTNGTGERKMRDGTITAEVTKLWSRDRGASKKETLAVLAEKFPDKEAVTLDNTVRGLVHSLPKTAKLKMTKTKDEKRGLVYNLS